MINSFKKRAGSRRVMTWPHQLKRCGNYKKEVAKMKEKLKK
jgi:hypothetical protein